jgi:hypothetical protein
MLMLRPHPKPSRGYLNFPVGGHSYAPLHRARGWNARIAERGLEGEA